MIPKSMPPPPHGLSLGDIYYILFRHKGKIALISGFGLVAALLLPAFWARPYISEAKLFIRYVLEAKSTGQIGVSDARVKSLDERGENVINTELEILTSFDLVQQVVTNVGPDKILARAGGGADPQKAASIIHRNLLVDVPRKSNVVRIIFQHPDPFIVEPVLSQIIETYLKRHAEIHRAVGFSDDSLTKETEELRASLAETENTLRKIKTNLGIISLEDAKKGFSEQTAKIQQAILDAEAELAERQAAANEITKLLNLRPTAATNESVAGAPSLQNFNTPMLASSNSEPSDLNPQVSAAPAVNAAPVPSPKLAEYKNLAGLLETLGKKEQDLALQFTPENVLVKSVQEQIAANEKRKKQLEDENPGLLAVKASETKAVAPGPTVDPRTDLLHEMARVTALESKIRVLTNQLAATRNKATIVEEKEGSITELQRKKELDEAHYKYFSTSREQSRIDERLGAGRVSNISIIQLPSPPSRDSSKLLKAQITLLFGGIAAALALAFLIELYFDRTLKRPGEIERMLGIPLFLSIPRMSLNGNGKARSLKEVPKVPLLAPIGSGHGLQTTNHERINLEAPSEGESSDPAPRTPHPSPRQNEVTAGEPRPSTEAPTSVPSSSLPFQSDAAADPASTLLSSAVLHPFFETLRDRLIAYFELKNLTHKPKLVAVTSCGEGAGVSTTAAGLAASLSETGDGNVLLVDMNLQQGAAHHFHKGSLECGLDDALEIGKRGIALVQDNLYVVSESTTNGDQLPRVLPKRFKHLVPKLRASDYDFIIFDMPPVSQISATPRLARFMDMVFLVVESEKTDRDVVKRASSLLAESEANLGVVLNKNRTYVPKLLQQEL